LHDRTPAAELHETLFVPGLLGEHALFVVVHPGAVAVHGLTEEPRRTPELIELRRRCQALQEQEGRSRRLQVVVADG